MWTSFLKHSYSVCDRSSVVEIEAFFLSDGAEDISPHNYRTIALLNSSLAFFSSNFSYCLYYLLLQ